jgi:uncharacterized integral membrane protein (TIGR00697 family)
VPILKNLSDCRIFMEDPKLRYFSIISGIFVAVLLIANTVATKLFALGPFIFTGAILVFPISYIFGDILTEVYGYSRSRRVIWTGLACLIFMSVVYWIVGLLPSAPGWQNQSAYNLILGIVPRIAFASIIAYFAGEFSNSYVLSKFKILTKGKHLWTRTIGSTVVGEAVDSILFVLIAFFGVFQINILVAAIFSAYFFKVIYEVIATPVTYLIVRKLKEAEGMDIYDHDVNYNPFRLR